MERWEERILELIGKQGQHVSNRLLEIDKNLVKIDENLKEHMRRTEAAENGIEALKNALIPITAHVNHVEGALKLIGLIALVSTVAGVFWQMLG